MRLFGLIGNKLKHSFSKTYFEKKWLSENILDCHYDLFELNSIEEVVNILNSHSNLIGLNVTIPYKNQIIPYLNELSPLASEIQSVNCIKKIDEKWFGHNTDAPAFLESLQHILPSDFNAKALILGTGGSSKAAQWALKCLGISFDLASTSGKEITYEELEFSWNPDWKLIINTTPLGMWPNIEDKPLIPYQFINESNYLYDLIYNPEKTLFLKLGSEQGSRIKNGLEMLHLQANKSWQFWND